MGLTMKTWRRLLKGTECFVIIAFLIVITVAMDSALYLLKKVKRILYFPGG